MKQYFGFAIADSMFPEHCQIERRSFNINDVRTILQTNKIEFCLNPSHKPTIDVAIKKYGLAISIPEKAPLVSLMKGDSIIVMSVRGLPRLEGRHEYTDEEINKAEFKFGIWIVR